MTTSTDADDDADADADADDDADADVDADADGFQTKARKWRPLKLMTSLLLPGSGSNQKVSLKKNCQ